MENIHLNSHGDECNITVWWLFSDVVTFGRRINCTARSNKRRKPNNLVQIKYIYVIAFHITHLAASRSFIDKLVVGSSDLMALLLLFKWLLWLWLLLLLRLLLPSLPLWWCAIALSDVLWPTDVVIDVTFKSVMRSTVFSDSYVTACQKLNEINDIA